MFWEADFDKCGEFLLFERCPKSASKMPKKDPNGPTKMFLRYHKGVLEDKKLQEGTRIFLGLPI